MKKFITKLFYTAIFAMALSFGACQEEFEEVAGVDDQETITANSSTATLIKKTSSKDGSFDNIVDGASCIAINFPYTVEVNGIQITIDAVEDLHTIENIFDEVDIDQDILDILFPITITLADFTEIVIETKERLRELAAVCLEGGSDDDIECIDFVYPITLFTFNIDNQQTGEIVVNKDSELRRFFAQLEENALISINFPLTLKKFDGTEIMVDSNAELVNALERAKDECDEDDDNDYNDDDFTKERLDNLLVECPWWIEGIWRDNLDMISDFEQNLIQFNEDGTVTIQKTGAIFSGTWESKIKDWRVALTLEFENVVDLNLEWFVYEIGEGKIKLFKDGANRIILESACDYEKESCTDEEVVNNLSGCKWIVANAEEGSFLTDLTLDFSNMNIHVRNPNETVVDEGNWEIENGTLTFNDLSMVLANYIGEWVIIDCRSDRLEIKRGEEVLVIEKDCD
ncbi:hypothetical protein HME9304_00759 [Flagellimonas maritima]|uniref:Uncharacterized protein n=1 Tax=Flagellimonas maritima TaxID=1383885 RepID=A0A2Z4LQU3_9FLAO|nr:hypothetical protein [Allomuricauda aurantiaca]AWX43768.1 hypothetical protein HME9304_00759 [Allomuricauda aurantiaca]